MSVTAAVTSRALVMMRPSGSVSSASAFCTVVPVPPFKKVSSTNVGVSGAAYLLRSMELSRLSPLASP